MQNISFTYKESFFMHREKQHLKFKQIGMFLSFYKFTFRGT